MYRLEFWDGGQAEGYLGQVSRSRSKVKDQGHKVKKCQMGHYIDFLEPCNLCMDLSKKKLRNMTGRNTMLDVYKHMRFLDNSLLHFLEQSLTADLRRCKSDGERCYGKDKDAQVSFYLYLPRISNQHLKFFFK